MYIYICIYPHAITKGRRSFKTINLKLNKPENLCPKIDVSLNPTP